MGSAVSLGNSVDDNDRHSTVRGAGQGHRDLPPPGHWPWSVPGRDEGGTRDSFPLRPQAKDALPGRSEQLANEAGVVLDGSHPSPGLVPPLPGGSASFSPAVPPACHKQRA
jgi:hypothetical protein